VKNNFVVLILILPVVYLLILGYILSYKFKFTIIICHIYLLNVKILLLLIFITFEQINVITSKILFDFLLVFEI